MNNHQFFKQFSGVIPIVNYRGVLVEKLIGGYKVFDQKVITREEVDNIIDNACYTIKQSIKR